MNQTTVHQSIWYNPNEDCVEIIDQRKLPFDLCTTKITSIEEGYNAISDMIVRGAPLIGVTAAYALWLGIKNQETLDFETIERYAKYLMQARPTAVNLELVLHRMLGYLKLYSSQEWKKQALIFASQTEQNEIEACSKIGDFGLELIRQIAERKKGEIVNILTHCNAGWLACVQWGTATAPIYKAHLAGIKVHVWVDETRPRNQGARLTAWELNQAGVPFTVIADNTGGHLMQHKLVDMVIVGSDRTTRNGDVANKIGTYLKALAAKDNEIPFYVALPSSSIDFTMLDGVKNIPIEERHGEELTTMECLVDSNIKSVNLMPTSTPTANYGFDVTPARLVSALITERGTCEANEGAITILFPEK